MSDSTITFAAESDLVNFTTGGIVTIPVHLPPGARLPQTETRRVGTGQYVITYIDRGLGTITISSDDRVALSGALGKMAPALDALTPLQAGIAASVALAGLGWIIARRNALAETEREDSASWAASVVAWFAALVRGLCGKEAA